MEQENILLMERYHNPTEKDCAPYGTIWKVVVDQETSYFYVQIKDNAKEPEWIPMDKFLEKALEPLYANKPFIDYCIEIYRDKKVFKKEEALNTLP